MKIFNENEICAIENCLKVLNQKVKTIKEDLEKLQNCNLHTLKVSEIDNGCYTIYFDFGTALVLMREGKKVSLKNWSPDLYIYISELQTLGLKNKEKILILESKIHGSLKYNWTPTHKEIVSEEWYVVE